ncbi:MAG: hypothetical protein ACOCWQ_02335 [Nanoarchaeota archaeon]
MEKIRSEPRLFYYIRINRDEGKTDKEIQNILKYKGYTQNDISQGFRDFSIANDHNDEDKLVEYFEQALAQGHSFEQLIQHSLDNNVNSHLVQRAVLRTQIPSGRNE